MNVGIFVTHLAVKPGRENNVSGHLQVALRTAELLQRSGHDVAIIATRQDESFVLPTCVPSGIPLHFVSDSRRRGEADNQDHRRGIYPFRFLTQLLQIMRLVSELELNVLHLFGFKRIVQLAALLKLLRLQCVVAVTIYAPVSASILTRLYRRIDLLFTATTHVAQRSQRAVGRVRVLRHGVVKDLYLPPPEDRSEAEDGATTRVLFWREGSAKNGADLAVEAFSTLATRSPDVRFTFALRHNRFEEPGINELAREMANVDVYRYPYPPDVTLESLLSESICVVMPFRTLTMHPQMAVAESLAAGCRVVVSDVDSLPELITSSEDGIVMDGLSAGALIDGIEQVCASGARWDAEQRSKLRQRFLETWDWQTYVDELQGHYAAALADRGC
jgi:glycosyltransferase involved in cell wall biosynthesis